MVAQGSRPIRAGQIMDYTELLGMRPRRGTQPVARRQAAVEEEEEEIEAQDVVIGHGRQAENINQGGAAEQVHG